MQNRRVKRPAGTKLNKRGKNVYVYHVLKSDYDPVRKFNIDKKVCIGKLEVPNDPEYMLTNDKFPLYYPEEWAKYEELPEPPLMSDTVRAGTFVALRHIATKTGLRGIMQDIYGEEDTARLLDLLCFVITDETAVFSRYEAFMRSHLMLSATIMSDVAISRFLVEVITEERISDLLRRWNRLHVGEDMIYIGYDSTNFSCEADIAMAEFGAAKEDKTRPQVNFAVTVKQKDTTPLDYEVYPGSIVDMSECCYMLQRMHDYGYTHVGFLFDRGYHTENNIRYLLEMGYDFIMMADENTVFIRELIAEVSDKLKNDAMLYLVKNDVSGTTLKRELYGTELYFHVYYDELRASMASRALNKKIGALKEALLARKGQRLRKNANLDEFKAFFNLEISEHTEEGKDEKYRVLDGFTLREDVVSALRNSYGFFCIIATSESDSGTVIEIYRGRDNIEKFFRSIKWGMDMKTPAVHSEEAMQGKFHVMFLAAVLRNSMLQASRSIKLATKNRRDFTVTGMIDQLEAVECTRAVSEQYRRRYALTAKQKTIFEELGVTEATLEKELADFNLRMMA